MNTPEQHTAETCGCQWHRELQEARLRYALRGSEDRREPMSAVDALDALVASCVGEVRASDE